MTTLRQGLQEIIAHEGGELLRTVPEDDGRGLVRVHEPFDGQQRRRLAVAHGVRHISAELLRNGRAFLLQVIFPQALRHLGARFQGPDCQGLQAGVDDVRLVGGNLPHIGLQEVFRILHSPSHTNDAGRRQIFRHKARILRTRGFDRAAAGGHAQGEKG